MARAVVRVIVGLFMGLSATLFVAPLVWSANAQTLPPFSTTTSPVSAFTTTTAPLTSSASITPTTVHVPVTRAHVATTTTTSTSTTTTTIAPISAPPVSPATIPLAPIPQNANISPIFAILSVIGLLSLVGLLAAQWFLTAPGHRGPTL